VAPRAAATVAVLRDGPTGMETLMLLRPVEAEFAPRAQVFPGGAIDSDDSADGWDQLLDLGSATDRDLALGSAEPQIGTAVSYVVGAIREVLEETSLLLGIGPDQFPGAAWADEQRGQLAAGVASFADVLRSADLKLRPSPMVFFANWITPEIMPRRYDTRFFAARAPQGQAAVAALGEIQSLEWIAPALALERAENDASTLPPTKRALGMLARYRDVDEAIAGLAAVRDVTPILPRVVSASDGTGPEGAMGFKVLMPGDPGYE